MKIHWAHSHTPKNSKVLTFFFISHTKLYCQTHVRQKKGCNFSGNLWNGKKNIPKLFFMVALFKSGEMFGLSYSDKRVKYVNLQVYYV